MTGMVQLTALVETLLLKYYIIYQGGEVHYYSQSAKIRARDAPGL
jgi:hypothetical protein